MRVFACAGGHCADHEDEEGPEAPAVARRGSHAALLQVQASGPCHQGTEPAGAFPAWRRQVASSVIIPHKKIYFIAICNWNTFIQSTPFGRLYKVNLCVGHCSKDEARPVCAGSGSHTGGLRGQQGNPPPCNRVGRPRVTPKLHCMRVQGDWPCSGGRLSGARAPPASSAGARHPSKGDAPALFSRSVCCLGTDLVCGVSFLPTELPRGADPEARLAYSRGS